MLDGRICITPLLHHSITPVSIIDHEDQLIIDPGQSDAKQGDHRIHVAD